MMMIFQIKALATIIIVILNILSPTIRSLKIQKPPTDLLAPFEGSRNYQTRSTNTLLSNNEQRKLVSKSLILNTTPTTKSFRSTTLSPQKPLIKSTNSIPILPSSRQPRKLSAHQNTSKLPLQTKHDGIVEKSSNLNYAEITHDERSAGENGLYHYTFKTMNGINVEERGQPKTIVNNFGDGDTHDINSQDVQGEYSYIAPDGTEIVMNYIANENGFQPTGAHIPTPPPIPEAIQRALEYLRTHQSN